MAKLVFDESVQGWTGDEDYNFQFIRAQEEWLNVRLQAKGILFLNDVYETFGIPPTQEGATSGWIWEPGLSVYVTLDLEEAEIDRDTGAITFNLDVTPDIHKTLS